METNMKSRGKILIDGSGTGIRSLSQIRMIMGMVAIALSILLIAPDWNDTRSDAEALSASYIVQADSLDQALRAVEDVGAEITHELGIIDAVAARLDAQQRETLQRRRFTLHKNHTVKISGSAGGSSLYVAYPQVVDADLVHAEGILGEGVTVAVVDTGIDQRLGGAGLRELH